MRGNISCSGIFPTMLEEKSLLSFEKYLRQAENALLLWNHQEYGETFPSWGGSRKIMVTGAVESCRGKGI